MPASLAPPSDRSRRFLMVTSKEANTSRWRLQNDGGSNMILLLLDSRTELWCDPLPEIKAAEKYDAVVLNVTGKGRLSATSPPELRNISREILHHKARINNVGG